MVFDKKLYFKGLKDAIPIAFSYFVVAFSLGIIAKNAGLSPFDGALTSLALNASAGEYAAFNAIKDDYAYFEAFLIVFIANSRYILMSFALASKIHPNTSLIHRVILGYFLTDEYFSLAISSNDYVNPYYSYGAISLATPCWVIGTALGIVMGNVLPLKIVKALSIALYCMFIAIIIPAGKKDKMVSYSIITSFFMSYLFSFIDLSSGIKTIILTIIIASLFAYIAPRGQNE